MRLNFKYVQIRVDTASLLSMERSVNGAEKNC